MSVYWSVVSRFWWKWKDSIVPTIFFLGIAWSIIPFTSPGYFFLLDDPIFYSRMAGDIKNIFDFSFFPISAFLSLFTSTLDFWVIQRSVYFFVVFFLWLWAYINLAKYSKIGGYFAGLLALCNPFVFGRIAEWQVNVLWGITMGFWVLYLLRCFYDSSKKNQLVGSSILFALSLMWTPHSLFLVGAPSAIILMMYGIKEQKWKSWIFSVCIFFGIALSVNGAWIVGNMIHSWYTAHTIQTIDQDHYKAFATLPWTVWVYKNVAMLQGFWREGINLDIQTFQTSNRRWKSAVYPLFALVLLWILYSLFASSKSERGFDIAILFSSFLAYVLAIWVAWGGIFSDFSLFLYNQLPFYSGMREPQKWIGILLFGYVYFGGKGIVALLQIPYAKPCIKKMAAMGYMWMVIVAMPTVFWFLGGVLSPLDFPTSWYHATQALHQLPITQNTSSFARDCTASQEESSKCYDVLSLPWHQYITLHFTKMPVLNPTMSFFSEYRVLQGDNIEMDNDIYSQSKKGESEYIQTIFGPEKTRIRTEKLTKEDYEAFVNKMQLFGVRAITLVDSNRWNYENEFIKKGISFGVFERVFQAEDFEIYTLK